MSESPSVTVVVTGYNHNSDVARCLDGIFKQTVQDFNVNDCSQDNGLEVIENFLLQHYFRFMKNQKNLGLIQNVNHVIFNEAKGRYIKLIAADDFLSLNCLALLTSEFAKQNDNCALVYRKIQFISGQKTCFQELLFGPSSIPAAMVMFPRQHEVAIQ